MKLTTDFKLRVLEAVKEARKMYGGSDAKWAASQGIAASVWSQLKNGKIENQIIDSKWLMWGRQFDVSAGRTTWKIARTEVFEAIEADVKQCKDKGMSFIFVDDCSIGKTETAKYLSKTVENCFRLDCSQCKTRQLFIRSLAALLGVDPKGKFSDVKENLKYYLRVLEKPVIILDEAGDLDYEAFLDIKELWNATEGECGWYMMGAEGLRAKIERGITNEKVGYRENFSRFGDKFMKITPTNKAERYQFYKKLVTDVLKVNVTDKSLLHDLITRCLTTDANGEPGGPRRAKALFNLIDA